MPREEAPTALGWRGLLEGELEDEWRIERTGPDQFPPLAKQTSIVTESSIVLLEKLEGILPAN